jgi:hypothetical protein
MTDATNETSREVASELNGDDSDSKVGSSLAASDGKEPVVTRKELWSYYSEYFLFIPD